MPHRCLILGAGGHGRSVADVIRSQGDALLGFLDNSRPAVELVAGVPVIGALSLAREFNAQPCSEGAPAPDRCVVAISHPALRQRWQQVLEASDAPLGLLASLAAGEMLGCGESRFAELELTPVAAVLSESVSCAGFSSRSAGLLSWLELF